MVVERRPRSWPRGVRTEEGHESHHEIRGIHVPRLHTYLPTYLFWLYGFHDCDLGYDGQHISLPNTLSPLDRTGKRPCRPDSTCC